MRLTKSILPRLLGTLPVILGIVTVIFFFIRLAPGDPAEMMVGFYGDAAKVAQVRAQMGLDKPMAEQYVSFLWRALHGDLGLSLRSNQPVIDEIGRALLPTVKLAVASMVIAILVGVPAGVIAAVKPNSAWDHAVMGVAVFGIAVPVFWFGMIAMLIFGYHLKWLPPAGYGGWRHLILPAVTLSGNTMAFIARMVRSELLEALSHDYVRTARAKGLAERVVVLKHTMRNAMLPTLTATGVRFGELLGGAVLTETIFAWPGLGTMMYNAIHARDYTMIQGAALVVAIGFVMVNFLVDSLYAVVNPALED